VFFAGWLQDAGRLCPGGCAKEPQQPLLSLVRELSYDRSSDTLRILPVAELAGLRNGTLRSIATQKLRGVLTLVEAAGDGGSTARNRIFCNAIFILKMIILPRQARDKHRERALIKRTRFCRRTSR
jgi:hypothetical protein